MAAAALLGLSGAWQVAAERNDLDNAVERELEMLGKALQVSFANALRDGQDHDVVQTLAAIERIDPDVDVVVLDARQGLLASSAGADVDGARRVEPGHHFVEGTAELGLPIGSGAGRLVLRRPTRDVDRDLAATRLRLAGAAIACLAVLLLTTVLATRQWVAAPLARLVAHMRRVREGDLRVVPDPSLRRDAIGETLAEFEKLVGELAAARARIDAEVEARRVVERAVREMDKLATVGQLAAGLAHEIGSPLQVLEGRLASLARHADDSEETRRLAGIAREQAARITRIVARLSNLVRRPPTPGRVDAAAPVESILALLAPEARRRGVSLTSAIGAVPRVRADTDAIQQVALNLIQNALEATPAGGQVALRLSANATELLLEVEDDGKGMTQGEQSHAFEPFFTTRSEGTGLGLAVVRSIVGTRRSPESKRRGSRESSPASPTSFAVRRLPGGWTQPRRSSPSSPCSLPRPGAAA